MMLNPLYPLDARPSYSEPPIVTSTRRTAARPWSGDNLVTGSGARAMIAQPVDAAIMAMPVNLFGQRVTEGK